MIPIQEYSLVLVSPKGPVNVGGVARLMGNFGLSDLRLVEPRCDWLCLEAKQMSMHGFVHLQNAKIYPTLKDAQSDLHYSIAFSGRSIEQARPRYSLESFCQEVPKTFRAGDRVGLIFGREEWGLRLDELDLCDHQIFIPTDQEMTSLNLTSAVGIALYRLFQSQNVAEDQAISSLERPQKKQEDLFFTRILDLLERVKFTNPQNPESHMTDIRSMFHRAHLSDRDLRILFGILSGIERELQLSKDREQTIFDQSLKMPANKSLQA